MEEEEEEEEEEEAKKLSSPAVGAEIIRSFDLTQRKKEE